VLRLGAVALAALVATPVATAAAGSLKGWGRNDHGQLDGGVISFQGQPTPERILRGVRAAGAGQNHSLAVTRDGSVWAWGSKGGSLGDPAAEDSPTPQRVAGLAGAVAVAGSWSHSLALLEDGSVWAWGGNDSGQLGDGTTAPAVNPVQVPGLAGVVAIDAEYAQSFALTSDGTLWAWGENDWGQVGNGTRLDQHTPMPVLTGVSAVAAGQVHTLALRSDGTIWAWGNNWFGQLGLGTQSDSVPTPEQVPGLAGMSAVGAGYNHSLAVGFGGTVFAWGYNLYGQVDSTGGFENEARPSPVQVAGLSGIVAVTGGWVHSFALGARGRYWGWGADHDGQLGDGTANVEVQAPTQGLAHALDALVAGEAHTLGF
jgi:alpha-tubulin suppressor-like RCC1 family protein